MITKMKNEWKINPKMNSPALKHTHTHSAIYLFLIFSSPPIYSYMHSDNDQSDDSVVVIFRVLMFCLGPEEILIAQKHY